jgi:protein transport protein SEC61 subunit gamma-like protein
MDGQPEIPATPAPQQIETEPQPQQIEQQHHKEHHEKPQGKIARKWTQLKEFVKECKRVLTVTKKPSAEEFKTIVKISGLGILLIGFIGFLIHFAREGLRYLGF